MNEIRIMELEKLLNDMDVCIEDMSIYFEQNPHEFTEGAYRLLNEMEEERTALEELIIKIDED